MVHPRDVAARQNLPRRLDRSGETVARTGRHQRIVKTRRQEVGYRDARYGVRIFVGLAGVARLHQVAELARAVLDLAIFDLDRG